ncbi:MAG TPA: UDP-3-O-acyl-N-acetylglucosamine deacetylase [Chitinophagales bacterium]|nr:UDP-3-O-acyl-N-acetylglucosamine deacetylase [Chitinophagales bacterium]HNK11853.1 UDP-3-O-acyl-N-acetylglucosamine deacetylase [Chitinophagales bacterium]HNN25185.1 UDP-3-O-acyl-N-acetylglucosamine deacetylase [Chitinophagales bacterium]HRG35272.1 UDP-3-O-acyl-N-acetylglucosamine deacetylase [Chitinophagales bacterium]
MKIQKTITQPIRFSGVGLHTGLMANVVIKAAPENFGIQFCRIDFDPTLYIPAIAANVSNTNRSTTITKYNISVITIEHLMSALYALGIDNALIEIDNKEVPILDGSAKFYIDNIKSENTIALHQYKKIYTIHDVIEWKDEQQGAEYIFLPHDEFSVTCLIDFPSKMIKHQYAVLNDINDYANEIATAKTFCFLHEIEFLYANGLIKGGNLNNALVFSETSLSQEKIKWLASTFHQSANSIPEMGILNPLYQTFDNEAARHKLLDVIGDLALTQTYFKGKLIAYKPGHTSNCKFASYLMKNYVNVSAEHSF